MVTMQMAQVITYDNCWCRVALEKWFATAVLSRAVEATSSQVQFGELHLHPVSYSTYLGRKLWLT